MADYKDIERVHRKRHTYSGREKPGKDKVVSGSFSSRADAVDCAKKKAERG